MAQVKFHDDYLDVNLSLFEYPPFLLLGHSS